MEVNFTDNADAVRAAVRAAMERALKRCGLKAEGYAKELCQVDTGILRSSINHKVVESEVYIGTNLEYAPYVELGTGKYFPGGRQTSWSYMDEHGRWHRTNGQKAQPYLKPAVADYRQTYQNTIMDELKG